MPPDEIRLIKRPWWSTGHTRALLKRPHQEKLWRNVRIDGLIGRALILTSLTALALHVAVNSAEGPDSVRWELKARFNYHDGKFASAGRSKRSSFE